MSNDTRQDGAGSRTSTILVVGSANMDLAVTCGHFPRPGETVLGDDLEISPGGKGANQAVACARLGADVRFLCKMGDDLFHSQLVESLHGDGVDVQHVLVDEGAATGVAFITVDATGENQIVVASGSNMKLTPDDVSAERALFEGADVVLLQLEIPLESVERAAVMAKEAGAVVVLNPAPARPLPASLLAHVDWLTPNESEAAFLAGVDVNGRASAEEAAQVLLAKGVRRVVVTLGGAGALLVTEEKTHHVPACRVKPVDTTAAGDAFNGALAYALAQRAPGDEALEEVLGFANRAAACAVTRRGAQSAMPTLADVEAMGTAEASPSPRQQPA